MNDELYTKIQSEMNKQLRDNISKVKEELNEIKSKQSMLSTLNQKKEEER